MRKRGRRTERGFTLVELMIVVAVIGVIASIAIPNYQKFTARSRRAEMQNTLSKLRLYFKNIYDNQGTFSSQQTLAVGGASAINPDAAVPPGTSAPWDSTRVGWVDMPFPPEGKILMRYRYKIAAADTVEFQVCAQFPSFGVNFDCGDEGVQGNYYYDELFHGNGTSDVFEKPNAF
jgi:prepilin-type N-terminal cleavage/methylation domain-containing protein